MELDKGYNKINNIPGWMLTEEGIEKCKAGKLHTGFLRRTLAGVSKILQEDLLCERLAAKKGLLQQLDTRVKLVTLLFYMIFAGATQSMFTLVLLAAIAVTAAQLSGLGLVSYFKRVWCIVPLIMFAVSMPAATNLFIQGRPLLFITQELYITWEGLFAVLRMCVRVGVSISFGYLLITTTRWTQLTKALRVLRIPRLFITILDMSYRYIFVLIRMTIDMFEARFLRTVGNISNKENRKFMAGGIAFLFLKSHQMSEEIFDAMVCRGYGGQPVALRQFKFGPKDLAWLINHIIIALVLILGEILFG